MHVMVSKIAGQNGGPVKMYLASVLGVLPKDVSATSVAMVSFPKGMKPGSLFPLAASKFIVDQEWTKNPPVSFKIGESATNGTWTSFKVNNEAASYVAGLISGGNPEYLKLNDMIWLQPGAKASNYGNAESLIGKTVVIALYDDTSSLNPTPIKGFVAFKIEAVNQGQKWIQGHLVKDFIITQAQDVGWEAPDTFSSSNPPQLVNWPPWPLPGP
jgi:hypothetical protein